MSVIYKSLILNSPGAIYSAKSFDGTRRNFVLKFTACGTIKFISRSPADKINKKTDQSDFRLVGFFIIPCRNKSSIYLGWANLQKTRSITLIIDRAQVQPFGTESSKRCDPYDLHLKTFRPSKQAFNKRIQMSYLQPSGVSAEVSEAKVTKRSFCL